MQKYIKETWRLVSTTNQCQNGRLLALKWLDREYEQQFAHIRGYVEEILTHHERTTAIVETYPNAKNQDVFSRFYVCFEKLRTRWKSSCRPIIGLDGTFFKGIVKGCLLTAFMKNLKADLGLEDGSGYVIISDRCKGLLSSVKAELPKAEHRFCVKHIYENLKKNHAGKDLLKKYVWNVAWSCTMTAYRKNLQKLKEYDVPLFEDVLKMEPRYWTLAFFKLGSFCDKVENNSTESFNATITKARGKAIIPMLETIRRQAMVRNAKRQKKAERWDGRCTKYVKLVLKELKEHADKCVVSRGSHGNFEVDLYDDRCHVDTKNKTCSCFKWQISGIPCEHAYGAMLDAGLDTDDYVYECFYTGKQRDCYSDNVKPMRGPGIWMAGSHRLVVAPPEQDPPEGEGSEKKKKKKSKKGEKRIKARCKIHPKKKRKMTEEASDQANTSSQGAGNGAFQGPETMSLTQPSQMSD
ncbi:unnamed protein product [Microthlaspi erraticum]|uniref:SWIM-type domain-containing protein n=1 Tax=Microthlaspi erraticum TaxID=1685480 RepID=A0A6D2KG39_9BRAS|nr:unnamed protein product [Microthlaspi erraticum]